MPIFEGILKNNLKYVLNQDKKFRSTTIFIFIRVGSKHEIEEEQGMAHFLEHLLFKGTKKFKTNMILNKKIDNLGAQTNAATDKNYTCYYLKLPSPNVLEGIKVLKEMVFESKLDSKELEKEKEVVIEEMNKTFDDSEDYINDLIPEYLFKDHNLGHHILGKKNLIRNMKRSDIMKFYKKHYIPNNSVLVITGNFDMKIQNELPKIFNNSQSIIKHNYENFCFPKKRQIITKYRDHNQITLGIAFPIFNYFDKRKYCLDILISYLDGYLTSKLWVELREKEPLIYSGDAGYDVYEEGGYFQLVYSLEKKNVFKSLEIVNRIFNDIKNNKIKEEEFEMFKINIILNIEMDKEDADETSHFLGEEKLINDKILSYQKLKEYYENCKLEDLDNLGNSIFNYEKILVNQLGDINKKTFQNKVDKIFV